MSAILIAIYAGILAIILVAAFVVLGIARKKGRITRALNMSLFLISVPRENRPDEKRQEKEQIAVMEQLYSAFTNLHSKGWNKFVYGEPYLALEMSVHHLGEEIHFYMAVPRYFEAVFEKLVHGVFPTAEVVKVRDYSVFNPQGFHSGGHLTLKAHPILPIRTYQKLEADPLGGIATALSKLVHEGEGASIQVLIRPSHKDQTKKIASVVAKEMQSGLKFSAALYKAEHPNKKKGEKEEQNLPRAVTPLEDEMIKGIQAKGSKPLFDTNIRIVASSSDQNRSDQILNDVAASFVPFSAPEMNSFKFEKVKPNKLDKLLFDYSFRIFDNSKCFLLSSEEITSIYHFPLGTTLAPRIKFLKAKPAEAPPNLPSEGIVLGKNKFRGIETPVRMTDEDRRRHLYIIGQTGTGKSTAMKALLRQDVESGKGVCLIDPHGEFAEFVLSVVPQDRFNDVIYFDPGDVNWPMGLNMLEIDPDHPEQKSMVIDELFTIFEKLYDLKATGGPMFEKYFKNSALLLLDDYRHEIPTLADISRVMVDDVYRNDKLSRETNPLVVQFWRKEAEQATGEQSLSNIAPYITSKITSFVFNEFLRPIVNQQKSAFNFREVMDSGKILVINLSKGKIGDLNANLLGMVIVGKLLMSALSRVDMDEKVRKDFYLYIDEFQNFTTDSIGIILSEARKYRLNLIIAHQFIKQLKESIRDAVFGNVGSIMSFRVGPDDAEYLKNKFEPVFTPADLVNIDNLNAYLSLIINGQTTRPFNILLETDRVFGAGSSETAFYLKEMSRQKFARPRQEVEDEIKRRFEPPPKPATPF